MPGIKLEVWLDDTPDDYTPYSFTLVEDLTKTECDEAWEYVLSILKKEPLNGHFQLHDKHIYHRFPMTKLRTVLRKDLP